MCNAYNHPPDCNCGWGGGWSNGSGRAGSSVWAIGAPGGASVDQFPSWLTSAVPSHESFTNPNASCPVCGTNVFYYQSPYGGRVYFDALGPPWPKHACTDRSASKEAMVPQRPNALPRRRYEWQDDGWSPIVVRKLSAECAGLKGPFFTIVYGICEGVEFSCHVIEEFLYERLDEDVSRLLVHARFEKDGSVSLSFLDNEANEFYALGFRSLPEAKREYEETRYGRARGRPHREQSAIGKALADAIRKFGDSKKM